MAVVAMAAATTLLLLATTVASSIMHHDSNFFRLRLPYYSHYTPSFTRIDLAGDAEGFGLLEVLDFPITLLPDLSSSPLLGAERCLGAITHAVEAVSSQLLHLCTITYNDTAEGGGGWRGTFTVQGEANLLGLEEGWELAITGGTGDFRGAIGYLVGSIYDSSSSPNYTTTTITELSNEQQQQQQIFYYVAHIYLPPSSSISRHAPFS